MGLCSGHPKVRFGIIVVGSWVGGRQGAGGVGGEGVCRGYSWLSMRYASHALFSLVVCWLLDILATCEYISGTTC